MNTFNDYMTNALRTENDNVRAVLERLSADPMLRLLHAVLGLSTESAELLDIMKKHLYYGAPFSATHVAEEIGDLCWYLAVLLDATGLDLNTVLSANIEKLRVRYPERYTDEHALIRSPLAEVHALLVQRMNADDDAEIKTE